MPFENYSVVLVETFAF